MRLKQCLIFVLWIVLNVVYAAETTSAPASTSEESGGSVVEAINSLVNGYGKSAISSGILTEAPFDFKGYKQFMFNYPSLQKDMRESTSSMSGGLVTDFILSPNPTQAQLQNNTESHDFGAEQATINVAQIPGSDFASSAQTGEKQDPQPDDKSFDFSSLIDPLEYASTTQKGTGVVTEAQATNFINTVMHLGGLSSLSPNITDSDSKKSTYAKPAFKNYLANFRAYAASQSIAAQNFSYLFEERKVVPHSGQLVKQIAPALTGTGGTNESPKDVSLLKLQSLLATRRFQTEWYNNLLKASPSAMQREELMLLAEIRYELFLAHLDNERLLATLSALLIQNNFNYATTGLSNQNGAWAGAGGSSGKAQKAASSIPVPSLAQPKPPASS